MTGTQNALLPVEFYEAPNSYSLPRVFYFLMGTSCAEPNITLALSFVIIVLVTLRWNCFIGTSDVCDFVGCSDRLHTTGLQCDGRVQSWSMQGASTIL